MHFPCGTVVNAIGTLIGLLLPSLPFVCVYFPWKWDYSNYVQQTFLIKGNKVAADIVAANVASGLPPLSDRARMQHFGTLPFLHVPRALLTPSKRKLAHKMVPYRMQLSRAGFAPGSCLVIDEGLHVEVCRQILLKRPETHAMF